MASASSQTWIPNVAFTLGFASQSGSAAKVSTYDGEYFEAENVARLTRINGYLLHGDIVNQGLSLNNCYSTILTEIQLSVGPGKLLTYNPYNPYKLDGNHLKFGPKSLFTFYLTDEKNKIGRASCRERAWCRQVSCIVNRRKQ